MNDVTFQIDTSVASKFLHVLDPTTECFTFQTFDDASKKNELAKIIHSNLDHALPQLDTLQAEGAGIFVTVNETDGNGRKAENIVRIRAIFADCDGVDPLYMTNLKPHVLIESSPGRYHLYWRVSDCELDQFKRVQQAIAAKYGTDKTVCDLPRVMRLPGAWHQKGEPVQAKIIEIIEQEPYRLQDIIEGLNLTLATPTALSNMSFSANNSHYLLPPIDKIKSALYSLPECFYNDYDKWRDTVFAVHWAFNGAEAGFQVIDDWSKQSAKYGDTRKLWDSIKDDKDNGITIGSLFYWARQNGWLWTHTPKLTLAMLTASLINLVS
jgi:hypothetical protein